MTGNDFIDGTVIVLDSNRQTRLGTGFIVRANSEEYYILTCSHVIQNVEEQDGNAPNIKEIPIIFSKNNQKDSAKFLPEYWRSFEKGDIAVFKINSNLPIGVKPLSLGMSKFSKGKNIETYGYPNGFKNGTLGNGTVCGDIINDWKIQLDGSNSITTGFSGAPAVDKESNRVIGMIQGISEPDKNNRGINLSYIIKTEKIIEVCNDFLEIRGKLHKNIKELPEYYQERSEHHKNIKELLLREGKSSIGVVDMRGYG